MRKHEDGIIVWPSYLDSNLSRAKGRRIPKNLAAPDVTLSALKEAATMAGFEYEANPEKKFPRKWTGPSGYIVLKNPDGHKKKRLLLMLAKGVRRVVAQRESEKQAVAKKGKKSKKGKKR
jgi:signal recognition particle subunit SRP19